MCINHIQHTAIATAEIAFRCSQSTPHGTKLFRDSHRVVVWWKIVMRNNGNSLINGASSVVIISLNLRVYSGYKHWTSNVVLQLDEDQSVLKTQIVVGDSFLIYDFKRRDYLFF